MKILISAAVFGFLLLAVGFTYADGLLIPGTLVISHIRFWDDGPLDGYWFWAAALLSYYFWLRIARFTTVGLLRRLGLHPPESFQLWSWLWPWRPFYKFIAMPVFRLFRETKYGREATAKWTPFLEVLSLLYRRGDVLFGRLRIRGMGLLQPIGWRIQRHIVVIGATAAGKTRWLITLLALHVGNIFAIDVAAQMVNGVGSRLGKGGKGIIGLDRDVHTLDPYGQAHDRKTSRWNVHRECDRFIQIHGVDSEIGFAHKFGEAIIKPEGNPVNAWVTNEASAFASSMFLYMRRKYADQPEKLHLVEFRRLISVGLDLSPKADSSEPPKRGRPRKPEVILLDGFRLLLADMKSYGGPIAADAAVMESSMRPDGGSAPRSSLLDQTRWLDLPEMQHIVTGHDFDLHDMKLGRVCLFLCAPVDDLAGSLSGFFRLTSLLTLTIFRRLQTTSSTQRLAMVLDEMPSLGRIDGIETIAPEARKHGIQPLVCVAQELEGIMRVQPSAWRSFFANADARVFMSTVDQQTIDYVFEALGTTTREETADAGLLSSLFSKVAARAIKIERPLLYKPQIEDILHPDANNALILRYGRPLIVKTGSYYVELPVFYYNADPRFVEKPGRRLGRALCERFIPGPESPALVTPTVEAIPSIQTEFMKEDATVSNEEEVRSEAKPGFFVRLDAKFNYDIHHGLLGEQRKRAVIASILYAIGDMFAPSMWSWFIWIAALWFLLGFVGPGLYAAFRAALAVVQRCKPMHPYFGSTVISVFLMTLPVTAMVYFAAEAFSGLTRVVAPGLPRMAAECVIFMMKAFVLYTIPVFYAVILYGVAFFSWLAVLLTWNALITLTVWLIRLVSITMVLSGLVLYSLWPAAGLTLKALAGHLGRLGLSLHAMRFSPRPKT